MSIGGKGNYDTEFSTTFRFCLFFFFFPTEKHSNFSKNFLLHFGIMEETVF